MPGLSESFFASKNFTLIAAAFAFIAAAILLSVIFRFAFGRRLRLPRNGRARLPRLGTVDAFDLDRQRQLVIIRRDNVEHLLMIGGPNDLVIELQIVRAESREPRDFRETRIRDKDGREREPREAPLLAAGVAWPSQAESPVPNPPERKMPQPAAAVMEPGSGAADGFSLEEPTPGFTEKSGGSAPRYPAFPAPPRRTSPAAVPAGQRFLLNARSFNGRADPSSKSEPATGAARELRRASVTTPFLRSPPQRPQEGMASIIPPSMPETPPAVANPSPLFAFDNAPAPPEVVAEAARAAEAANSAAAPSAPAITPDDNSHAGEAAVPALASADSLEAEMAKLLGRGPG